MLPLSRPLLALLVFWSIAWTAGCGDKLDPGVVEDSGTTILAPVTAANGNADAGNGNDDAGMTTPTPNPSPPAGLCGTSSTTIGYAALAKKAIAVNCGGCHTNAQPPDLSTKASAKAGLQSGGINRINDTQNPMPPTGGMTANDKCIILGWASGGYLD